MDLDAGRCACGARFVGDPILEPSEPEPMLGAAVGSVVFALLSIGMIWLRPAISLAVLALFLGVRGLGRARRDPRRYGGVRTALAGIVLASAVVVGGGGYLVSRIPIYLENRRMATVAATQAEMYHMAAQIQQYRVVYGAYPDRLSDLARVETIGPVADARDSWERKIIYSGYTSGLASAPGGGVTLNANFELRSPGPDGLPNTPDDIIMRDGEIVDATAEIPGSPTLPVTVPVTNRIR